MTAENDTMRQMPAADLRSRAGAEAGALDVWLRQDLAARYDPTLSENLPVDLIAMISNLH